MHKIQIELLKIANIYNLGQMTFDEISHVLQEELGKKIGRQQVKHHLEQLLKKKALTGSRKTQDIRPVSGGVMGLLFSIPIMGNANCGEAMEIAEDKVQEYVQVSKRLVHIDNQTRLKRLFGVRAVGESMNNAQVGTSKQPINNGDIVLVDPKQGGNIQNKYMLAVIDGVANIKRVVQDAEHNRVILRSESTTKYSDIYLHEDDLDHVFFAGEVAGVIKG